MIRSAVSIEARSGGRVEVEVGRLLLVEGKGLD